MLQHIESERTTPFGKVNWAEKRNCARRPKHEPAKIVVSGNRAIDCTLVDLSDTGACLQVATVVGVPETFELKIEGDRARRICHFRWALDGRIGVKFI